MCDLTHASEIILVAGGIGITPIMSVLRQLCHIFSIRSSSGSLSSQNLPSLPPVTLIWSVRQGFLLSLFCEHLVGVLRSHFSLSLITIKVYYTASNPVLPPDLPLELKSTVACGARPDISGAFAAAKERSLRKHVDPAAVHAIACGPESLTSSVQHIWCVPPFLPPNFRLPQPPPPPPPCSLKNGFTFFNEDFYF
jgi:hypothetical protein